MKKKILRKALRFGVTGFLWGCFAYLLFSVLVSLRMGTGDFCLALPALAENYSSKLSAAIAQIVIFTWFGSACGIAYMFGESVELDPPKQGAGYLASLTVGMLPLAWTGQWFKYIFVGIFSYIIIVAVVSLLLFVIGLVKLKCDIAEIKQAIETGKEVNHEEI